MELKEHENLAKTSTPSKQMSELRELQKKILRLLKDNSGEMDLAEVCDLLKITMNEVPWGHNIGWSKCIQPNQKYHLILSGQHSN